MIGELYADQVRLRFRRARQRHRPRVHESGRVGTYVVELKAVLLAVVEVLEPDVLVTDVDSTDVGDGETTTLDGKVEAAGALEIAAEDVELSASTYFDCDGISCTPGRRPVLQVRLDAPGSRPPARTSSGA